MEGFQIVGRLCAVVQFDYDMSAQGGPKGTAYSAYVSRDFAAEAPVKIKLPADLVPELYAEGFGCWVEVVGTLGAEKKGNGAQLVRKATRVTIVEPPADADDALVGAYAAA